MDRGYIICPQEFLNGLSEKLILAYKSRMRTKNRNDYFESPNDKNSIYYFSLQEDISHCINKKISTSTIHKLFFSTTKNIPIKFHSNTIRLFEEYIEVNSQNKLKQLDNFQLRGSTIINELFFNNLTSNRLTFTKRDFYISKQNDECQWYGIANQWAVKRGNYSLLITELMNSFRRNSFLSLLITGHGGVGKSTILRQLAYDSHKYDSVILWVNDFDQFINYDFDFISNNDGTQFLLFIDDGTMLNLNSDNGRTRFNNLSKRKNLRLILADRESTNKSYIQYLYGNNEFKITSDENEYILSEIISNNPMWLNHGKILTNKSIYNTPLYAILYVLAQNKDQHYENFDTIDFLAHFKEIFRFQLNWIFKKYRGLAIALYYWSCLYKECLSSTYHSKLTIGWNDFLKVADHYNGNHVITDRYRNSDIRADEILNPIVNIQPIKIFAFNSNIYFLFFNHDLIPELGLSQYIDNELHIFDNKIKIELLEVLINNNASIFSLYLLHSYYSSIKIYQSEEHSNAFFENISKKIGQPLAENYFNDILENISNEDNDYWETVIYHLFSVYHDIYVLESTSELIKRGCRSTYVKRIHRLLQQSLKGKRNKEIETIKSKVDWIRLVQDKFETTNKIDSNC